MTKQQRTTTIVVVSIAAVLGLIAGVYYSRAFWVWRVKSKWGKRFPFLLGESTDTATGYTAEMWGHFTLAELRRMADVGLSTWFDEGTEDYDRAVNAKSIPTKKQVNP